MEILRKEYNEGKLRENNPLHMKIIHYLKIPNLAAVEMRILKNLADQKEKQKEWENEKDKIYKKVLKKPRKRKFLNVESEVFRNVRRKSNKDTQFISDTDKEEGYVKEARPTVNTEENQLSPKLSAIEMSENLIRREQKNSPKILSAETPKQRQNLMNKFGMITPSPLIKQTKITVDEMKRFSVAVHLWAEHRPGGMKILQQIRLKDKHFQEILSFAGPGTKWNLLKNRSSLQYRALWRNSIRSKNDYRGHHETGYETNLKVHDPSSQFCPFEHCISGVLGPMNPLEMDLILLKRNPVDKIDVAKTNRQLFEKEEDHESLLSTDIQNKETLSSEFENILKQTQATDREESLPLETDCHAELESNSKPSPTKNELKRQILELIKQNQLTRENIQVVDPTKKVKGNESSKSFTPILVKCKIENCGKEFTTIFGLNKHKRKHHSEEKLESNPMQTCTICGKDVVYIDKHIKAVHKDVLGDEICEICQETIKINMKKHRGVCIYCPVCGYKNAIKNRLLKHINICKKLKEKNTQQTEPLDLSPQKKKEENKKQNVEKNVDSQATKTEESGQLIKDNINNANNHDNYNGKKPKIDNIEGIPDNTKKNDAVSRLCLEQGTSEDSLKQKRTKFPFDIEADDEFYLSEFEEDDAEEYTKERRIKKDKLELRLREIDLLQNKKQEGDNEILEQFLSFMKTISSRGVKEGGYSQLREVGTVKKYTKAIENDILPAFHDLFHPFDSRWLLDCTTKKDCTFEGEKRCFVKPEEPIYFTSIILRKSLERYKEGSGQDRATVLAASVQLMNFIELHFNNKLSLYGREPLKAVISYHNGVKSFINGTKEWKACNKDKERAIQVNKAIKEYENPNFEAEILERYQLYIKSPERLSQITKLLEHSAEGAPKVSDGEMTELGQIMMGEIIASTGCRPVVVRRLTVGAYVSKKPGFNPHKISKGDCVVDEDQGAKKIYRRLNPNLPPKHLACKHQLEHKTTRCPVDCEDRCDPEGFNMMVDWDKTDQRHYLHLAKPIKDLMDLYNIIRSKYFQGRKSAKTSEEDWLEDLNTPFFLNSATSPFQSVNLRHISEAMGVDVTAHSFRRIVSTWALSHESEEIRNAEEEVLQHSLKVAKDKYLQNKQVQPQTLTQKYIEEECLFPENFKEDIQKTQNREKETILLTEDKRQKQQHETLLQEKAATKQLQLEKRPLGPRQRILGCDRNEFKEILERTEDEKMENILNQMKVSKWRNHIVKLVCTAEDEDGEDLRNLWVKVYKGDLRWGVRDARLKSKEKNWPRKESNAYVQSNDRNSWIASSLRKSFQSEVKTSEKKNYLKLIKKD